jgi:hypothetical protein
MVETREREVVYTEAADGPSAVLVVLFSLLVVAVLGFMIYYFSNNSLRMDNPTTIIERNTTTTTPVPMPVPTPTAPSVPDVNITPPSTTPAPEAPAQ